MRKPRNDVPESPTPEPIPSGIIEPPDPPADSTEENNNGHYPVTVDIADEALRVHDEYSRLRESAIVHLLEQRRIIEDKLHRLGYADPDVMPGPTEYSAPRNAIGVKKCPVCGAPGHDARSHRAENLKQIAKGRPPKK